MDTIQADVSTDSSPVQESSNESTGHSEVVETAEKSPGDEFRDFLSAERQKNSEDSDEDLSIQDSDSVDGKKPPSDEKPESTRKDEEKTNEGFKKRIDKEVAKRKAAEEKLHTLESELDKMKEILAMYQEENGYLSSKAVLDEREESFREREYRLRWQEKQAELAKQSEQRLQQRQQEAELAERKQQLREEIFSIADEYFDAETGDYAVSPEMIIAEIQRATQQGQWLDPRAAARQIEQRQQQAWKKRMTPPPAPTTASNRSSGTREPVKEVDWRDRDSAKNELADFLRSQSKLR